MFLLLLLLILILQNYYQNNWFFFWEGEGIFDVLSCELNDLILLTFFVNILSRIFFFLLTHSNFESRDFFLLVYILRIGSQLLFLTRYFVILIFTLFC